MGLDQIPEEYREAFTALSDSIEFTEKIEKGANGVVVLGRNKLLGRGVAVKFYYWGGGTHIEPRLLAGLEHPSILTVDDARAIDRQHAFFVTRLCEYGDLDDYIARNEIGSHEAVSIFREVAFGVSYLHGSGYLHRDLKPSNIFRQDNGRFLLGDFGSVVSLTDGQYGEAKTKHSLIYRPPEDFDGDRFYRQGDVYQLGILLYQLLGGSLPYEARQWLTDREARAVKELPYPDSELRANEFIAAKIKRGRVLDFDSLPFFVPQGIRRIIRKATHPNMNNRHPSVENLLGALNNASTTLSDWKFIDGHWTVARGNRSFRCFLVNGKVVIEKKVGENWRRDNSIRANSLETAAQAIANL